MEFLPMTFASGVSSGINAYATVLLLGLYGRFGGADIPEGARPALEFIAGADPEVGARVRALRVGADGTWVGRLDGGADLRLGSGERMAAKAATISGARSRANQ